MPEVIPNHVPSPGTLLAWDGTAYRPITIDAAGHIQIDVLSTVMDVLAATAPNQVLMNANLALIAEIRDALLSVNTDRLQVRGEDQLFSYLRNLSERVADNPSGDDGYLDVGPVAADRVWVVTNVVAWDETRVLTNTRFELSSGGFLYNFGNVERAIGVAERIPWGGHVYADPTDNIRVHFVGCLAADTCHVRVTGYVMRLE